MSDLRDIRNDVVVLAVNTLNSNFAIHYTAKSADCCCSVNSDSVCILLDTSFSTGLKNWTLRSTVFWILTLLITVL